MQSNTNQFNKNSDESEWTTAVSLTLYSCIYRMLLRGHHQRRIMWVWFSRCQTGGVMEHNVAHFETLEGTGTEDK